MTWYINHAENVRFIGILAYPKIWIMSNFLSMGQRGVKLLCLNVNFLGSSAVLDIFLQFAIGIYSRRKIEQFFGKFSCS